MSVDRRQLRDVLDEQLADLDGKLGDDDVQILAELQQGIQRLVEVDSDAENTIRRVLQERIDRGELREETFELVCSILDKYVTEDAPTFPGNITYDSIRPPTLNGPGDIDNDDDRFSSTTVLPHDVVSSGSADDRVQVGSVLRDRFLLQERVAGGSMGVVFKALDRRLAEAGAENPYVAIKVLSPQLAKSGSALRALQQEAAKGRWLVHPNIVRFLDLDRDEDLYFIVLEWLEGQTLATILDSAEGEKIDVEQSIHIVQQIGKALEYAHRCGIVHADVKPGNIMMLPNGDAKLFDFGIARVRQTKDSSNSFDPAVLRAVTPAYSSMQVLTGEEPTPSDDVFSLACLLYRLVAGYRVFGPRNAAEAAEEGMTPQRLEALSDTQWGALRKAISFARVARFETVTEFLEALTDTSGTAIQVDPDLDRVSRTPKRTRSIFPWIIAAIAAFGAGAWYFGGIEQAREWIDESGLLPESLQPRPSLDPEPVIREEQAMPSEPEPATEDELADELPEESADDAVANDNLLLPGASGFEPAAPLQPELVTDFSSLPAADVELSLIRTQGDSVPVVVTLREDGDDVTVDLLRTDALDFP
ncbi:MAG: serine/threonine protein kinase, partial [Woeseiaceae bacterium]|nr:serine/threonine protein kinase [Woeseiaceae bacterium]